MALPVFRKNLGLSLLQFLIIVILIIFGFIAIKPLIITYLNIDKINKAMGVISLLNEKAKNQNLHGELEDIFIYEDYKIGPEITGFDMPPVVALAFFGPHDVSRSNAGNQWVFCIQIKDLSFEGYIEPEYGQAGNFSRICDLVTNDNGTLVHMCGRWDDSELDIPKIYLPSSCNCESIVERRC